MLSWRWAKPHKGGGEAWVKRFPGYPAVFHTTWAAAPQIDGCVDNRDASPPCTAVLLSDEADGIGFFAMLSAAPVLGNYSFAQPGNAPIVLTAIPPPTVEGSPTRHAESVRVAVRVDAPSSGSYVDPGCPSSLLSGYKIYAHVVAEEAPGPTGRERDLPGGWSLASGGESSAGTALVPGTQAVVDVACDPGDNVYLASSLVFDSGFETAHVSANSAAIRCEP